MKTNIPCTGGKRCICDQCYPKNISLVTGLPYDEVLAARREREESKIRFNNEIKISNLKGNNQKDKSDEIRMKSIRETKLNTLAVSILRDFGLDNEPMIIIFSDLWRRVLILGSLKDFPPSDLFHPLLEEDGL